MLLFCLTTALTQCVNPSPHDGWFQSRSQIVARTPGGDNYTPVAAPAFLYATVHLIAVIFSWDLVKEFYLASFLHHILLFFAGLFVYLSLRCLGLAKSGLVTSVLVIIVLESTLLPQTAISENVAIFLMSVILFVGLYLFVTPHLSDGRFVVLSAVMGLLLGVFVATRAIPILVLPATFLLYWRTLSRNRLAGFTIVATAAVLLVVLGSMTMNVYRFGRFELSNSTGRHLWNAVTASADEMLADSREYQLLKQAQPDIQGKYWWEVMPPAEIDGLKDYTPEELLRKLSFEAISAHPVIFVEQGLERTWRTLRIPPNRIGMNWALYYNPLRRTTMLPAMARPWPAFDAFLKESYQFVYRVYEPVLLGMLLLGFVSFAVGAVWGERQARMVQNRRVWLFSTGLFLVSLYVSCQIEVGISRYVIPYFPLLAVMVSTTFAEVSSLVRKLGGAVAGPDSDPN